MNNLLPHQNLSLEDMEGEIWKDIEGFDGYYQISSLGRVKSLSRKMFNGKGYFDSKEKFLVPKITNQGYFYVALSKNSKAIKFSLHRLIAVAFLKNPLNKKTVNHKDSVKTNNSIANLEWASHLENNCHRVLKTKKSSKYIGVSFNSLRKKWQVSICILGKSVYLGRYKTEEEAYQARCEYEKANNIENKYL